MFFVVIKKTVKPYTNIHSIYTMFIDFILLICGFTILIYGANILVDGGAALARRLNVSAIVIGLTIVAFGTSAPELVVNVVSSVKGSSALALGNVLGSNIFNILVILGVTALMVPLGVKRTTAWIEIPMALSAAVLLLLMIENGISEVITRTEGVWLLGLFVVFLIYTFALAKYGGAGDGEEFKIRDFSVAKSVLWVVLGVTGLVVGGRLLVDSAVSIAHNLGISERIIGLTIVSIGTSLPELATSVIAARKKNAGIAIGNVVGSNLFNTFMILGMSATITPVEMPQGGLADLVVNIIAAGMLFLFVLIGRNSRINRVEGGILLVLYILYLCIMICDI